MAALAKLVITASPSTSSFVSLSQDVASQLDRVMPPCVLSIKAQHGPPSFVLWDGVLLDATVSCTIELPARAVARSLHYGGMVLVHVVRRVPRALRIRVTAIDAASWATSTANAAEMQSALLNQAAVASVGAVLTIIALRVAMPVDLLVVDIDVAKEDLCHLATAGCALLVEGTEVIISPSTDSQRESTVGRAPNAESVSRQISPSLMLRLIVRSTASTLPVVMLGFARRLVVVLHPSDAMKIVRSSRALAMARSAGCSHTSSRSVMESLPLSLDMQRQKVGAVVVAVHIDDCVPQGHIMMSHRALASLAASAALRHERASTDPAATRCTCLALLRPYGQVQLCGLVDDEIDAVAAASLRLRPLSALAATRAAITTSIRMATDTDAADGIDADSCWKPGVAILVRYGTCACISAGRVPNSHSDPPSRCPQCRCDYDAMPGGTGGRTSVDSGNWIAQTLVVVNYHEDGAIGGVSSFPEHVAEATPKKTTRHVLIGEPLPHRCAREISEWTAAWNSGVIDYATLLPPAPAPCYDNAWTASCSRIVSMLHEGSRSTNSSSPVRCLITGQPGSGRSTMMRLIAASVNLTGCISDNDARQRTSNESVQPFHVEYVSCRELVGTRASHVHAALLLAWARCIVLGPSLLVLDDLDRLLPALSSQLSAASGAVVADDHVRDDADTAAVMLRSLLQLRGSGCRSGGASRLRAASLALVALGAGVCGTLPLEVSATQSFGSAVAAVWDALIAISVIDTNSLSSRHDCCVNVIASVVERAALHPALREVGALDHVACELAPLSRRARARMLTMAVRRSADSFDNDVDEEGVLQLGCVLPSRLGEADIVAAKALAAATRREPLSESVAVTVADVNVALIAMATGLERPLTGLSIGGMESVRQTLADAVALFVRFVGGESPPPVRLPRGALLFGPPGCGKTVIGSTLAGKLGVRLVIVRGPELLRKYVGESEAGVRRAFAEATARAPCILFFDELDALAPRRGGNASGVSDRIVNTLLVLLDGVHRAASGGGVFVLGATSRPTAVDPALLRPGRLEVLLYCAVPSPMERADIISALASPLALTYGARAALPLLAAAEQADGWTGADLRGTLATAQLLAVRDAVASGKNDQHAVITTEHLEYAFATVRPSITQSQRAQYDAVATSLGVRRSDITGTIGLYGDSDASLNGDQYRVGLM